MQLKSNIALPIVIMLVFAVTRWPGMMPQNFSAAYAVAFCAGLFFPKVLRWILPLGTLFVTDVIINVVVYKTDALNIFMVPNYICYAALIGMGAWLGSKRHWLTLLSGGLVGALLFYVVTNTMSWLTDPGYTKNFSGWFQALTRGLPGYPPTWVFFRNTLLSGGLFTGLFVAAMSLSPAPEPQAEEETEAEGQEAKA